MTKRKLGTIFRVESVLWVSGRCPTRKTFTFQYGYFASLQEAEKSIPYTGYTDEVLFYIITEIILNRGDMDWSDTMLIRIYNSQGKFINETKTDDNCVWQGREPKDIRYKIGDVVEVFDYFKQEVRLGIVACLPNTTTDVESYYEKHEGVGLGIDEDKYGIIHNDGTFRQGHSCFVFEPFRPVPNKLKLALSNILKKSEGTYKSPLEEISIFVSRLKKV